MVNFMPQLLYLWEKTAVPLNRRFGMPESKAGCQGEVKILPFQGVKSLIFQPIT